MSQELVTCDNDGCNATFVKKTHNQRYCTDECCRLATNRRIMEKYYAKRDQRQGKVRYCKDCGVTKLSRYNDSQICSACKTKKEIDTNRSVLNMILNASIAS